MTRNQAATLASRLRRPEGDAEIEAIAERLRAAPSFASVPRDDLRRIAAASALQEVAAGEVLFRQGETGRHAYLVLEGEAAVEVTTETGTATVAVIRPGGFVGEIAAFAATPRTATVVARGPVRLLRIGQDAVRAALASSPDAAMEVIAELGRRLQANNGAIATLTQATHALADGRFEPAMLDALRDGATRFGHFAEVFGRMAAEIQNKRLVSQEMETAAGIQRALLPAASGPAGPGGACEVEATMEPARQVGGDFYDLFLLEDGRLAAAVGDVSGKGVPAALFMAVAKTVLRTVARQGGQAGDILAAANAILAEDNAECMFVTVALALVDPATGAVDFATGGHEEFYVVTAAGVAKAPPLGPALGLFPGARFATRRARLDPGDLVVLATDGVTEAMSPDGALFGSARLEAAIARRDGPLEALVRSLVDDVGAFSGGRPLGDDLTCLALRYLGPPGQGQRNDSTFQPSARA